MVIDTWHPVTSDFGLIQAPIDDVVTALLGWHNPVGIEYEQMEIAGPLSDAFNSLLPLCNAKQRRLFVQTESDWTACFQNGIQGSDPFPAMSELAKRMEVLSMRVCATPPDATWPATIWEVYAPESLGGYPPLNYRRSIAVSKDGGRWMFEQSGPPFHFEKTELYEKPHKRDRFSKDVLCEYLGHFSLQPFNDSFFILDADHMAILLQQIKPVVSMPEFSLEEVVEGVPWKKEER